MDQFGSGVTGNEPTHPAHHGPDRHARHPATAPSSAGDNVENIIAPSRGPWIAYVSKFPPSPSGIALYAAAFQTVLAKSGPVLRVPAPSDPRRSQMLSSALTGFLRGRRLARRHTISSIHVELGGRSLYEFYLALGALSAASPHMVITCHDVPSLVGPPCLFGILDRRGLRRLGMLLSRTWGRALEARLVAGADAVICLTDDGAGELARRFRRDVMALPHVADAPPLQPPASPRVFLPGYLGDPQAIRDVIETVAGYNSNHQTHWHVVVGACRPDTAREVISRTPPEQLQMTTLVGFQDEPQLLNEYSQARVVVRIRGAADSGNRYAASGPLVWAAARGSLIVTDDDRAGAREMADHGLLRYSPHPILDLPQALEDATDELATEIARRTQEMHGVEAVWRAYAVAVRTAVATPG